MVAAITQLGQTLHLEVVAEGLESADQVEALGRAHLPAGPGVPLRPAAAGRPGRRHAGRRRPVGRGPAARLTGGQAGQLIRSTAAFTAAAPLPASTTVTWATAACFRSAVSPRAVARSVAAVLAAAG